MNRPPLYDEALEMVNTIKHHLGNNVTVREWIGVKKNPNNEMQMQTDIYFFPQPENIQKQSLQITNSLYTKLGGDFTIAGPKTEYIMEQKDNGQPNWKPVLIFRVIYKKTTPWYNGLTPSFKVYI
jgi:hypothetical protein